MKFTNYDDALKAEIDEVAKARGLKSGRDLIADLGAPTTPCLICLVPMGDRSPHRPHLHAQGDSMRNLVHSTRSCAPTCDSWSNEACSCDRNPGTTGAGALRSRADVQESRVGELVRAVEDRDLDWHRIADDRAKEISRLTDEIDRMRADVAASSHHQLAER